MALYIGFVNLVYDGQMAEWLKATDCKSVLSRVRRFESFSAHESSLLDEDYNSGSSSFGRAIAFQAIGGEFEPRLPLFTKLPATAAVLLAVVAQW